MAGATKKTGQGPPKIARMTLATALKSMLKQKSGRKDIEFHDAPNVHQGLMDEIPITERAGYPLVRPKGAVDPANWRCNDGKDVMVDFSRHAWLPDDWGQGVKITNPTAHSTGTLGGTYTVMIAPDGKVFYHKPPASEYAGKPFDLAAGFNGQVRQAKQRANETIQLVRRQIREISSPSAKVGTDSDKSFFALLSKKERAFIADPSEFHFSVVSARRATKPSGIQDIFTVQSQCQAAGVTPTWYVDAESLEDYRKLGLKAVVGGKLTPSRNKALVDAHKLGKVCVQLSDDITAWEYRAGPNAQDRTDDSLNQAHADAKRYILSPVAAAQFILAKMRGAECEGRRPHLGGVYMLGSCARTFASDAFQRKHFIIGDFFVADVAETLTEKFNEEMTLKEDYDFTCSHIRAHGSVMRCSRMTLNVKHYSNAGGAVTNRDGKGATERRNIEVLFSKWPRSFRLNPKRHNEVIMRWPADDDAEGKFMAVPKKRFIRVASAEEEDCEEDAAVPTATPSKTARPVAAQGKTPSGRDAKGVARRTPGGAGATSGGVKLKASAKRGKAAMSAKTVTAAKSLKAGKVVKSTTAAGKAGNTQRRKG